MLYAIPARVASGTRIDRGTVLDAVQIEAPVAPIKSDGRVIPHIVLNDSGAACRVILTALRRVARRSRTARLRSRALFEIGGQDAGGIDTKEIVHVDV